MVLSNQNTNNKFLIYKYISSFQLGLINLFPTIAIKYNCNYSNMFYKSYM